LGGAGVHRDESNLGLWESEVAGLVTWEEKFGGKEYTGTTSRFEELGGVASCGEEYT